MTEQQVRRYLIAEGLTMREAEDRLDIEADRRLQEYRDEQDINLHERE